MIQLLKPNYPSLQELVRDLRTIESQGWTEAVRAITAGHGAPTAVGDEGEVYIDVDTGNVYEWGTS